EGNHPLSPARKRMPAEPPVDDGLEQEGRTSFSAQGLVGLERRLNCCRGFGHVVLQRKRPSGPEGLERCGRLVAALRQATLPPRSGAIRQAQVRVREVIALQTSS